MVVSFRHEYLDSSISAKTPKSIKSQVWRLAFAENLRPNYIKSKMKDTLLSHLKTSISSLRNLNLSKYPTDQIKELMKHFGKVAVIEYKLHPGKIILRARPKDEQWPYITRAALSYKPQYMNKAYQRASTPNRTMFYGSVIPEEIDKGDLDSERIVVTMEASQWLRCNKTCGVRRIAYSKWEVISDIKMIAVLQNRDFYDASAHTRKIVNDFTQFVERHPEHRETSLLVSDYLAGEFGKEQTPSDYDYVISALYTEYLTNSGFDGVLYPSVRVKGQGFNVAITPEAAESKIKLVAAGECTMYKRLFGNSIVDNDTSVLIEDEKKSFQFTPVAPNDHLGEETCLAKLGVKSIEELCLKRGNL